MGDSDDDFNRRRSRDKFVKERNDYQFDKRRDFGGGSMDRRNYGGPMNRGGGGGGNDFRGSARPRLDMSPPPKRQRREWDEIMGEQAPVRRENAAENSGATNNGPAAPTLMSFKQFLTTQDDSISDEDAIAKYQEYKLEFKRQQFHAFFIAHKGEEWFKVKYHPEDSAKKKTEQLESVKRRLEVSQELMRQNIISRYNLDSENAKNLVKFMDAVVIKLEGGTDDDVAALDNLDELLDDFDPIDAPVKQESNEEKVEKKAPVPKPIPEPVHTNETEKSAEDGAMSDGEASDKEEESEDPADKSPPRSDLEDDKPNGKSDHEEEEAEEGENIAPDEEKEEEAETPEQIATSKTPQNEKLNCRLPKMLLHKTSSIFLRNLSPAITKNDIETLCKRFPGFLRISLAEPLADRRYYRRGWVTFKRDVNIKDICWNLSSIRLKDCDMGPIVNRDLTKRIRVANGVTSHKQVAQNDLRLAAKLVQLYDKRYNLWQEDDQAPENPTIDDDPYSAGFVFTSRNPLLKNITDYLIEEASAEEEELLGLHSKSEDTSDQKTTFERDDNILKVLDRILLYLRIVHSIDYYNHGEYPCEDEMPNRCGLVHVRGPPVPPSQYGTDEFGKTLVSVNFINEFCKSFENHLQPLLQSREKISEEEADRLGRKDPDREIEAFINANCVELAKDKWLCPLSGKKFKGPEFIRKHIQNKHAEKLDEVKNEVLYFNNYVFDPKRPSPVDVKPAQAMSQVQQATPVMQREYGNGSASAYNRASDGAYDSGNRAPSQRDSMPPPAQDYHHRPSGSFGGYRGGQDGGYGKQDFRSGGGGGGGGNYRRDFPRRDFGGGGQRNMGGAGGGGPRHFQQSDGRRDPRVPVTYTDLDAPDDVY